MAVNHLERCGVERRMVKSVVAVRPQKLINTSTRMVQWCNGGARRLVDNLRVSIRLRLKGCAHANLDAS